ncbi:hypothetical protein PLICRDRAFT_43431 [Plicaturopsis crispa FD-325 SS-3]|nr:hypothetical protein PLICRDRAFT_43431 [Plicaturopsis crispa FD-325 SS-3]
MSSPTVYLISGANRGIGLGLVTLLAHREDVVIFAGARNPSAADSLQALAKQYPGKVHIVKLTSGDKDENAAAAAFVEKTAGRLDVVIANAAIGKYIGPVHETPAQELRDHFEVNVVGTHVLFQAVYPLLKTGPAPKFVVISTIAGSVTIGPTIPFGMYAYGSSKAALNWFTRKVHFENENFVSFAVHPGSVATDTALHTCKILGVPSESLIAVDESAKGIVDLIDKATRSETGGAFVSYDGKPLPW